MADYGKMRTARKAKKPKRAVRPRVRLTDKRAGSKKRKRRRR